MKTLYLSLVLIFSVFYIIPAEANQTVVQGQLIARNNGYPPWTDCIPNPSRFRQKCSCK